MIELLPVTDRLPSVAAEGWQAPFELYMPRQFCMRMDGDVIWTHVFADALIALSYFSIPFALVWFINRRRDVGFNGVFWMFAAFIFACGVTHVFGVVAIWAPYYRLDGWVKAGTGIISAATAIMLWRLMPKALTLPSPAQMRQVNQELLGTNERLRTLHEQLEDRVRVRTAELEKANERLQVEVVARERAEQAERSLRMEESRLRVEAERLNQAKDAFLSTLSHELRSPLNAVLGWSQLLTLDETLADRQEVREAAQTIRRNAEAQMQLVDDLLDMSRIVAGRLPEDHGSGAPVRRSIRTAVRLPPAGGNGSLYTTTSLIKRSNS